MDKPILDTLDKELPPDQRLIRQALDRYSDSIEAERDNHEEALDDLEMLAGRNHWPDKTVQDRKAAGRPTLVINKLPGFASRVANEGRVNKVSIKVIPNGSGSSNELAELLTSHIRAIESRSNAQSAYQNAHKGAVQAGFGYFRIVTSFTEETSFDQEILIKRIKNHFSVKGDPRSVEVDGSDSRYYFIDEMISRDEYKVRWPHLDPPIPMPDRGESYAQWSSEKLVKIAEYWVKVPKKKTLHLLSDGRTVEDKEWQAAIPGLQAEEKIVHLEPASGTTIESPPEARPVPPAADPMMAGDTAGSVPPPTPATAPPPVLVDGPAPEGSGWPEDIINPTPTIIRTKTVESFEVLQYLIDGEKIIEGPTPWAGRYIPIIPIWGEEVVVEDRTYRRGVIRFAKDPQRMYNYFRTAATETVALAPKAPYIGTVEQFEGYEDEWDRANSDNLSRLTYNHVPGVPPPQRQMVTQTAIGEITEANISGDEMKDTTSIQDASLGMRGNEVSGKAINARNSQSDVINYTYHDNREIAITFAGKILVDLIPRIYDTEREIPVIDDEEKEKTVWVNQTVVDPATGEKLILNDLTQGNYRVTTVAGPSFNTQREEAAAGMLDFIRTAPEAAQFVMDLIAENQNWPNATKIANRLRKLLPPGIDEEGPIQPQEPSPDDTIKSLKAQGIQLGNQLKQLDVVKRRRNLTDDEMQLARIVELINKIKPKGGENVQG